MDARRPRRPNSAEAITAREIGGAAGERQVSTLRAYGNRSVAAAPESLRGRRAVRSAGRGAAERRLDCCSAPCFLRCSIRCLILFGVGIGKGLRDVAPRRSASFFRHLASSAIEDLPSDRATAPEEGPQPDRLSPLHRPEPFEASFDVEADPCALFDPVGIDTLRLFVEAAESDGDKAPRECTPPPDRVEGELSFEAARWRSRATPPAIFGAAAHGVRRPPACIRQRSKSPRLYCTSALRDPIGTCQRPSRSSPR